MCNSQTLSFGITYTYPCSSRHVCRHAEQKAFSPLRISFAPFVIAQTSQKLLKKKHNKTLALSNTCISGSKWPPVGHQHKAPFCVFLSHILFFTSLPPQNVSAVICTSSVRLALTGIKCDCWTMRSVLQKTPRIPRSPLCQQVTR